MEKCHLFHGGKAYLSEHRTRNPRPVPLLDVWREIHHICNYPPYSIDAVSATKISISRHFPPGHYTWIDFRVDEVDGARKCMRAEKQTLTFTGDTDTMKPLLEYLYWFHNDKGSNPVPSSLIDAESAGPSWLPSLILNEEICWLNAAEKKILGRYGVDDTLLAKLDSMYSDWRRRGKQGWWLNIVAANELWFEVPQATFADMLKEHCL